MNQTFDDPVVAYMTRDPEVAHLDTPIEQIARQMHRGGFSGVPVVDGKHELVGVITRTDLIELGFPNPLTGDGPALTLPHLRAREVMTHDPLSISSHATLRSAARLMVDHGVHRVFVTEGGVLAGVLSSLDLTAAVRDAKLAGPVSSIMSSPIFTIDVHEPLGVAIDLLERARVTGVIVTDAGQPVGMFTQDDALAARGLPRTSLIEESYDAGVICVPHDLRVHRAAAHAAQLDVRRVVVCRAREAVGIVSGTDFAAVIARD